MRWRRGRRDKKKKDVEDVEDVEGCGSRRVSTFPRMLCNPISSFMNWRDLTGWIESFNWMFDEGEGLEVWI